MTPLIRKIYSINGSRVITLPKSWLEYYEKETGEKIEKVTIEVNRVLKIEPFFEKKKAA